MAGTKSSGSRKALNKAGPKAGGVSGPEKHPAKDSGKSGAGAETAINLPGSETGPESQAPAPPFAIVGVGASAGGLEAFTKLIENLPTNTGMGFVLVQHMSPRSHSMLPEILGKVTRMPVTEVQTARGFSPITSMSPPRTSS